MLYRTLTLCLLAASIATASPPASFQSFGRTVSLETSPTWITVRAAYGTADADAIAAVKALTGNVSVVEYSESRRTWLLRLDEPLGKPHITLSLLTHRPGIAWAMAAYSTPQQEIVGLTDEVLVLADAQLRPQVEAIAATHGARLRNELSFADGWLLSMSERTADAQWALIAALRAADHIDAQPNFIRRIDRRLVLNDPYLNQQWYLDPIDALSAWDTTTGNPNVIVAVMDDGFDMGHEDLTGPGKLAPGAYDFNAGDNDPSASSWEQHGTAVAGVAIATGNNGLGVAGVCPACRYMPIKQGPTSSDISAAFQHIGQYNAHVVNNSWGFYNPSSVVTNAIASLAQNGRGGLGTLVLFASGNEGVNIDTYNDISASNGSVAVSAVTYNGGLANYSNYGPSIDVGAPADGQVTTDLTVGGYSNGAYTSSFGGTSGACPVAAGVVGLIYSVDPTMTAQAAFNHLANGAEKIGSGYGQDGKSNSFGYGRVNAQASVQLAGDPVPVEPVDPDPIPAPDPEPQGQCAGNCGGQAPSGCYCDGECAQYGDCCADVCDTCGFCGGDGGDGSDATDAADGGDGIDGSGGGGSEGCADFFECSNACSTQACVDGCASGLDAGSVTLVNEVYGCLQNSGCLSASTDQEFQNCVATYCATEINACFSDTGGDSTGGGTDGIAGSADAVDGATDSIDGAIDSIDGNTDTLDGTTDSSDGSTDLVDGATDEVDGSTDGGDGLTDGIDGASDLTDSADGGDMVDETDDGSDADDSTDGSGTGVQGDVSDSSTDDLGRRGSRVSGCTTNPTVPAQHGLWLLLFATAWMMRRRS